MSTDRRIEAQGVKAWLLNDRQGIGWDEVDSMWALVHEYEAAIALLTEIRGNATMRAALVTLDLDERVREAIGAKR